MENFIEETILDNTIPAFDETPGIEGMDAIDSTPLPMEDHTRRGILKVKCKCGNVTNISEEVIEDGLNWTMLIGNDHFLTLTCEICKSELTMFIDEILEGNAISEKSNEE